MPPVTDAETFPDPVSRMAWVAGCAVPMALMADAETFPHPGSRITWGAYLLSFFNRYRGTCSDIGAYMYLMWYE